MDALVLMAPGPAPDLAGELEGAREIALSDQLAQAGAITCEVVEWELVGVNPGAVDQGSLLFPR